MGPTLKMKRRLNRIVAGCLAIFTIYIAFNLVRISIVNGAYYQEFANDQQMSSLTVNANRGTIYDAKGKILAQSATVWKIILEPQTLRETDAKGKPELVDSVVNKLCEILGVDKEKLQAQTQKNNKYEVIKTKVEKPEMDAVLAFANDKENPITALYAQPDTKRYYPNGTLAANVIGFTNSDNKGIYGLEASYDKELTGTPGRTLTAQDARGGRMPYADNAIFDPVDGNNLTLTLDTVIQNSLEKHLEAAIKKHKVQNRAAGIIMNAKTGAILAMATVPGFDLNDPFTIYDENAKALLEQVKADPAQTADTIKAKAKELQEAQWKNKAITEPYFPGSVFKVVTASSALEEKLVSLGEHFFCNGSTTIAGTKFKCWRPSGHGDEDFTQAMVNSCNPVFIEIGQRLGSHLFSQYFKAYGLTERTGIDLPGEVNSIFCKEEDMGKVELASSSFGQTNKITPIQMITAYAAVVNGGNLVTPYVVDKVLDKDGNVVESKQPVIKRQVISAETSKIMDTMLETVVTTNGGSNAYIKGYHIGGKSGTSQKQDKNNATGRDDWYVSSFVGFAPADDPEIIMLVMVDEPTQEGYYGSAVAAPVVRNVFSEIFPYVGIQPQYTKEELENMEVSIQGYVGQPVANAQASLAEQGLACETIGGGATVLKQVPARGSAMPRGSKVLLYTEDGAQELTATVPNVLGLTAAEANQKLTNAGLNIRLSGGAANQAGAKATQQAIAEGNKVPKGTVVEVTFVVNNETG